MALSAERLLGPLFPPDGHDDLNHDHTYGENEGTPGVKVVLADYQGWWAPMTHLFYSNASRCLVSAHPESSLEEVESFYCSHCLNYFAEAEAAASSHRCPRCFDCPQCRSALVIMPVPVATEGKGGRSTSGSDDGSGDGSSYAFRCGYCRWSSAETLGLVDSKPEDLAKRLMEAEQASPEDARFRSLVNQLRQRAVEVARDRQFRGRRFMHMGGGGGGGGGGGERWHLEDLEKKEVEQAAQTTALAQDVKRTAVLYTMLEKEGENGSSSSSSSSTSTSTDCSSSLSAEEHDLVPPSLPSSTSLVSITTAEQRQLACSLHQPSSTSSLAPVRRLLCSKRSRRCRIDVEEGRPGILLKPKVNPLEGDSSLRSNVGKWWQKDTSAVHVLPFVSVVQARGLGGVFLKEGEGGGGEEGKEGGGGGEEGGEEGGSRREKPDYLSFVLRLRNPLNGTVNVALVPPSTPPPSAGEETRSSSSSSSSSTTTIPYYMKRLSVALGSSSSSSSSSSNNSNDKNVFYAYVPAAGEEEGKEGGKKEEEKEEEEAELEAFEDEYLEDEEEDGDQETLDALALHILEKQGIEENNSSNSSSSSSSRSTVLLQRKSRAWLHVVVPPPASPLLVEDAAAVGVLLFLRLTSDRNEFSGTRGEAASIVVPVCLAFRRQSAESSPVGDLAERMTRVGLR